MADLVINITLGEEVTPVSVPADRVQELLDKVEVYAKTNLLSDEHRADATPLQCIGALISATFGDILAGGLPNPSGIRREAIESITVTGLSEEGEML